MEDLVGKTLPSTNVVNGCLVNIDNIEHKLAASVCQLTTEERKRALKFRHNGEQIVELMASLATDAGVNLPKASIDDMQRDLELAKRLKPLLVRVERLRQTIADTITEAQSEAWWAATAYYSALARVSKGDRKLSGALEPARKFFQTGSRGEKTDPQAQPPV